MSDQAEAEAGARRPARARRGLSLQTGLTWLVAASVSIASSIAGAGFAWREAASGNTPAVLVVILQISLMAALAGMAGGFLIAWRLHRQVSAPIAALTTAMQELGEGHDYDRTVDTRAAAEISELIEGFNGMLADFAARDREIATTLAALRDRAEALESELAQARTAARGAERTTAMLTATLERDLKSGLSGLVARAERQGAGTVARAGESLLSLVDDLVRFPDAGADGGCRAEATVDLSQLTQDVCSLYWAAACAKGLDLAAYVDPSTPKLVEGDAARLHRALGHLVSHALSLTEIGGVLIEVEPDSPQTVRVSVRDTGPGLPRQALGEAFAASTETGLGLALCRRLVESGGGRLSVTSQVGRGSAFAFRLPATVVEPATDWPAAPAAGTKVMIGHDGVSTRRALGRYLARAGYTPVGIEDEQDAGIAFIASDATANSGERATVRLVAPGETLLVDRRGADAVLPQPFGRDELESLLRRHQAGLPLAGPALADFEGLRPAPAAAAPLEIRLIDPAVAASLARLAASGQADVVAEVQDLYRQNAPEMVERLLHAAEAGEAGAAARAARSLQATSLNIGAREVARLAADIESAAREARPPTPEEVLELRSVLATTLTALPGPAALTGRASAGASRLSADTHALLEDFERAIDTDQLSLVYQPQFDREGRVVQGVETLVRWTHPTRGPISPALFIPIAEENGRIERLTSWVMTRALQETADLDGLQVAFNASALEFTSTCLVERLRDLIEQTGFDPRRLEVEITETAILANEDRVCEAMKMLRDMGVKVALDDFGAGYSSLGHLRRYPFDKLKIDREFVVDCTRDIQSATVVHAVVSIGRALGMKVVAEGVETEQQRQFLKIAGVHAMQGYLFGRPMPIAGLREMLAAAPEAVRARA